MNIDEALQDVQRIKSVAAGLTRKRDSVYFLMTTVLAAKAFQNDADLLLGRILLARRPADVLDDLLSRIFRQIRILSHLRSCERYDEPETLPSSIPLICLMSADGGQLLSSYTARTIVILRAVCNRILGSFGASGIRRSLCARQVHSGYHLSGATMHHEISRLNSLLARARPSGQLSPRWPYLRQPLRHHCGPMTPRPLHRSSTSSSSLARIDRSTPSSPLHSHR